MVLLLSVFIVLAAGCQEAGPPAGGDPGDINGKTQTEEPGENLCELCGEDPCACQWDGVWEGAGTEADPLKITMAAQLAEIARLVNLDELEETILGDPDGTVYIKLMNNISLSGYASGKGWTPIGRLAEFGNPKFNFRGVFDGNNKTITGLEINDSELVYAGLFGCISGGTVKNLRVENAKVSGLSCVGGLAGVVWGGRLENCSVTGNISGYGHTVNYASEVGGVVGGLEGNMINCSFAGEVSGTNDHAGGLAGSFRGNSSVENCYAAGTVTGKTYVGGLVGYMDGTWASYKDTHLHANSRMVNCYATGDVSGTRYVGGLVGYSRYFFMENCYATGDVSGERYVGGVAGELRGADSLGESTTNLKGCYSTGNVSGTGNYVGGLVGNIAGATIDGCHSTGKVSGVNEVGGVAGGIIGGSVKNCYSTGDVSGNDYVGGVLGSFGGVAYTMGSMTNCYAAGKVSGERYVGGLIGYVAYIFTGSRIENCAALNPSVSGESNVGRVFGIVGERAFSFDEPVPFAYDNIAFSGMAVTENDAAKTLDKGADKMDGTDIGAAAILADGALGGRFTAANGWTVQNGKLPGLGAAVDLPAHLK